LFSIVVHGDSIGAETLRRSLSDWLTDIDMISAGALAEKDGYIGYEEPYATSHQSLDEDEAFQQDVRSAALTTRARRQTSRRPEVRATRFGIELQMTNLTTTDTVADVLPESSVIDPALASLTPKSTQDRFVSSAEDNKVSPVSKSYRTTEATSLTGGVAAVAPVPK